MNTPAGFEPGVVMPAGLAGNAICFVWRDDRILARAAEPPTLPTLADVVRLGIDGVRHYLGRYCGRCGAAMRDKPGERAKECTACGHIAYPRISPAMMVLVTRGFDLLLARANRFPGAMYSALAGFVEAGESIEDCIHREVLEEVGIEVRDLRYFTSQAWPFPHSLMIAYTAEYAAGDMRPCDAEIADAQWFSLDALPQLPSPISVSRKLIDATIERLREARDREALVRR